MRVSLKQILNKMSIPLLFYTDNNGNSVFKNYSLSNNDGYLYHETFDIRKAGIGLEYRMEADKKFNLFCFILTLLLYSLLIQGNSSFLKLLFFEILWVLLIGLCRLFFSVKYEKFLKKTYGEFEITEFKPYMPKKKLQQFKNSFHSKVAFIFILICLFFAPAFLIYNGARFDLNSKKPNYKIALALTNIYNAIYPKNVIIYDMSAYSKYMLKDDAGALNDYKKLIKLSGKTFSKRDLTRFANLLFLEKKLYGSQNAIDLFNEYATAKKMTVMQESKMLWIKSIFSICNNCSDFVIHDYDTLLESLSSKDKKNEFYISSDKAYMYYLLGEYSKALEIYDDLILYASENKKNYERELKSLYAERGFVKRRLGDNIGADTDFLASEINLYEISKYEPVCSTHGFIVEKF